MNATEKYELIRVYHSGTVFSYGCSHKRSKVSAVPNTPVFHDHPGIEPTAQLELFDLSQFQLRYVSRRLPNQKHLRESATQLVMKGLE